MKNDDMPEDVTKPRGSASTQLPDRRAVLRSGAALSALAGGLFVPSFGLAQSAGGLPLTVPEWMTEQGRPIVSPPYGVPSPFEKDVCAAPA